MAFNTDKEPYEVKVINLILVVVFVSALAIIIPRAVEKEIRRQDIVCLMYQEQGYPVECKE